MTMMTCGRQLFTSTLVLMMLMAGVLYTNIALAAQTNNQFNVFVRTIGTGNPGSPNFPISNSAFCRSTSSGVTVTVVCKTGAFVDIEATGNGAPWRPTHGGAYRFITRFAVAADYRDTIASRGIGTVSSWRTINLEDRDYLELLIGW